ncbi:response regulator transcription factor [Pseudomonas sp. OV226]|uniref:response regulator transcription factor n=1 Tax=Pseudomonas sp. OV226 TaxID=2135588 RepID=UPI000D6A9F88|nr:helix-turn-helix transcriptional regulator [Pseudomonas sp. OV226]PWK31791.1 DNA-binding CsgD family transcriptional regulator [Pseudomonas sp. OV226]
MQSETLSAHGFKCVLGRGAAPRELQCLMAVAAGLTSKEAARDLGVAQDTVDKRLLSLTTKLGVTRRAALVAQAMLLGLISISGNPPVFPDPQRPTSEHDGIFIA